MKEIVNSSSREPEAVMLWGFPPGALKLSKGFPLARSLLQEMDRFAIGWALRLSWLVFLRFQSWVLRAIFVAVVAALTVAAMPGVLRAKSGDLT